MKYFSSFPFSLVTAEDEAVSGSSNVTSEYAGVCLYILQRCVLIYDVVNIPQIPHNFVSMGPAFSFSLRNSALYVFFPFVPFYF